MSVAPSTVGKAPASTEERRVLNFSKSTSRSNQSHRVRTSKSLHISRSSQQTSPPTRVKKPVNEMSGNNLLAPPRPPDPTVFIRAGTSGVRHLFPIHLTDFDCNGGLFSRSISRLRSRTPSTELCTNIEMIRNICSSIKTLQHFDVSENELNDLPLDICLLIDLETLNCSHNQLRNIVDLFEQLTQLKELDLSFNHFKRLPTVVYTFKYLLRLNCEHNSIKTIDLDFINLKHLKTLILDHNQLQSLETIDFRQIKRLEFIHIAHNKLINFPHNLHKLKHLKSINLSYNHLPSFPIDLLLINTLDVLNLSHNSITKLPPLSDIYKRISLIFSIDLSFNQLTKFYDYLLLISLKLDLSNNKISKLPTDLIRKLNNDIIANRELTINNNPLIQPIIPSEYLRDESTKTINVLQIIRNCIEEQQIDDTTRQGFKICITGCKNSGKTSLTYCLEEYMPCISDGHNHEQQDRIVNIHQFPFRCETINDRESTSKSSSITKPMSPLSRKPLEVPKTKVQRFDIDAKKRKNPTVVPPRKLMTPPLPPLAVPDPPPVPLEPIKSLPLTVFDFTGSSEYYEHILSFIDTNALHLICIHTADFHQTTPVDIEDVFQNTFDTPSIIIQLFQILQLLCEKVTKTNPIVILPVATCIDLYGTRPKQDKIEALEKINKFFKLYLQYRTDRIKQEIQVIDSLQIISSSLSDRLKTYVNLLNINIQIESCQSISSLTLEGINELNRAIQHCVLTQKIIFPHVDRILPTLWAETNQYIESLADNLPVPYLLWENFSKQVTSKHGLPNMINDVAMSLHDEGKILVLNEIGTSDRIVFLRPLWLGDLLTSLFRHDPLSQTNHQLQHRKEYYQNGLLHSDLVRSLWFNLLYKKEHFYHLWIILMRFFLIAYPKIDKTQLNNLLHSDDENEKKFDYAIVPYYLPLIDPNEQETEKRNFYNQVTNSVSVCYKSSMLPIGFFHRYSVSANLRLDIIYTKHWNNFILGEHEEKEVKFIIETDHRTYVICHCGTSIIKQPFDNIWNVLMLILNHVEEVFRILAPNNQFNRSVRCPVCNGYSFMGEWTTPKELQSLKTKTCLLCNQNVNTNYLVQPNENKRRNEELLKKIRERNTNRKSNDTTPIPANTTHLLMVPV